MQITEFLSVSLRFHYIKIQTKIRNPKLMECEVQQVVLGRVQITLISLLTSILRCTSVLRNQNHGSATQ